ncbi:MinD/ParA family protein [Entomospira culicis]|uniref:MinD/ParA family protein n=1 Tax=Entomospira culicis TaxID=2719989 RepID=A0A968GH45_9SPIO|nr:MinD/ParA family protein [Entomospira culicis]NIZ18679.1 MinD/ParA family protein [Entomospira culicis]NIZ68894.1 MinD/ParA family protein [Entomospira culicis]WDI37487.1 MinD/ParA family protein [Entomospira culicis]WDI39115.1 MinD/ParA family protein [Entomospira culicis]
MADQAEGLRELMKEMRPSREKKTRIIAVASGKGGVGKTNISINLAIAYAKLKKKVVVLDADLGLANVNVVMGVIPKYNLYHVVRKQKSMREIILDTNYGIQIVAGASGFAKIANLEDDERKEFIEELQELSYADIVIIDTSAGVSSNVLSFIEAADDVLIVITPEPTSITDAYGLIKIMSTEIDSQEMSLKLIVNRAQSVTEAKKVQQRVISIASQFLNLKVDYLGYVYDDPIVSQAVRRQVPFLVLDPASRPSECVMHLVSRLENVDYKEGGGMSKLLRNFLKPRKEM